MKFYFNVTIKSITFPQIASFEPLDEQLGWCVWAAGEKSDTIEKSSTQNLQLHHAEEPNPEAIAMNFSKL
jgi:hypothetical protein